MKNIFEIFKNKSKTKAIPGCFGKGYEGCVFHKGEYKCDLVVECADAYIKEQNKKRENINVDCACDDFLCNFVGDNCCNEDNCCNCKINNCRGCYYLEECIEDNNLHFD